MNRPRTTLFMISSLDGKISTGKTDTMDIDKDFPKIKGIKEGLYQYYDIEKTTDICSLISAKVLAKIGANKPQKNISPLPVRFVIIDNKGHLKKTGIENFIAKSKKLFIVTTNKKHPIFNYKNHKNVEILYYKNNIDFEELFQTLRQTYAMNRITIQSGGTLNAIFLRKNLIDHISLVIAPALIGGVDTPSLIDGLSLTTSKELTNIKALQLVCVKKLKNSYIHLKYKIIHDTKIVK